jgi:fimbrial chaperone protein
MKYFAFLQSAGWRFARRAVLAAATGACAILASAFSVTPIVVDLDSAGTRSASRVTITNGNEVPLPVEVQVFEVMLGPDGKPVERLADPDDILVLPPQDQIAPGRSRTVTFQYVGPVDIARSRYFEFNVDQVPVAPPEGQAALQIVYSVSGIMAVGPLGQTSQLSVVSAAPAVDEAGNRFVQVAIRNDGNRHDFLNRGTLTLVARNAEGQQVLRKVMAPAEIQQAVGSAPLAALATSTINIPVADLPETATTVIAEYSSAGTARARARR